MLRIPTLNEKQLDVAEKILINSANVILATMVLGNAISPKGFDLQLFAGGCILFAVLVGMALAMRKGGKSSQ